jgi:hypothetical protein
LNALGPRWYNVQLVALNERTHQYSGMTARRNQDTSEDRQIWLYCVFWRYSRMVWSSILSRRMLGPPYHLSSAPESTAMDWIGLGSILHSG